MTQERRRASGSKEGDGEGAGGRPGDRLGARSAAEPAGSHDGELRDMFASSRGALSEGGSDAEMQRAIISASLFGGPPVSIGRFLVEKVLGVGASAVVYATRDPLLDRRVALKVMARPHSDRREVVLSRVIREARAAAQLSHGNIVSIYEVGEWDGRPFIAMELIEGSTLAQWLVDEPRELAQICDVFLQAGRGLAAAHAQGRVHRDFKPANVLVASHGRVVVSDFGLAGDVRAARPQLAHGTGEMESLTREEDPAGPFLGTPAYAAPEQRGGVAAHPSADVYSFAISLVEALLGHHPHAHSSTARGTSFPPEAGVAPRPSPPSSPAALPSAAHSASSARPAWQLALRPRIPRQLFVELCAAAQPELWRRSQELGPLLEALRACAPARKRQRRGVYLVGASALVMGVALAAAIGVGLAQCGRRGPGFTEGGVLEPRPLVLADRVRALLETPPSLRDESWRQATRTLLLMPVATEVKCAWPKPVVYQAFVEGSVVAIDVDHDVYACDTRDAALTKLASRASCFREDGFAALEVAFIDGGSEVHAIDGRTWRRYDGASRWYQAVQRRGGNVVLADNGPCLITSSYLDGTPLRQRNFTNLHYSRYLSNGERSVWGEAGYLFFRPHPIASPQLLVRGALNFHVDDALSLLVAVSAQLVAIDLDTGVTATRALPPRSEPGSSPVLAIARDGSLVVAASKGGPLWWRRRGDASWRESASPPGMLVGLSVGAHERVAAVFEDGALQVIELESGRRYALADALIKKAHFLDEDRVAATDLRGNTWIWSLAAQRTALLAQHAGNGIMWGLSVSADASAVASSSGGADRSMVHVASLGEGAARAPEWSVPMPAGVGVHALTFDGERLLAGTSDSKLRRWDWRARRSLGELRLPPARWVWSLAVAHLPGEQPVEVVGMGQSSLGGESAVLLARGDEPPVTAFVSVGGGNTGINAVAAAPDGRLAIAAASSGQLAVIDLKTRAVGKRQAHIGEIRSAQMLAGGRRAITAGDDGTARIWEIGEQPAPLVPSIEEKRQILVAHGKIYELAVLGELVVLGSADGDASLFDLGSGRRLRSFAGHTTGITALHFSDDGRWLVSADMEGKVCLHRLASAACFTSLLGHDHRAAIQNARFLPDGRLLTSSDDRTVRLWSPIYDASDEELLRELRRFAPIVAP